MEINIYTDGSTKGNGTENAVGGWGYIIIIKKDFTQTEIRKSDYVENTTNNRMELEAVLSAINKVQQLDEYNKATKVNIYTDSAYIHNCFSQGWYIKWRKNGWINSKREPVKNKDLWTQLIPYFENEKFFFLKVKGHNGNTYNEIADNLAQDAAIVVIVDRTEEYYS